MNIVLAAINAKYIHSNLAVYSLRAYAQQYKDEIQIAEYTINQQIDDILKDLYKKKPDILCFSCYIWNLSYVEELVRELGKIFPSVPIWVGGPEVSYDTKDAGTSSGSDRSDLRRGRKDIFGSGGVLSRKRYAAFGD